MDNGIRAIWFDLDEKEWTGQGARMTTHKPGSPSVAERIRPAVPE